MPPAEITEAPRNVSARRSDASAPVGLPNNPDAERAVLGSMILEPEAIELAAGLLQPEAFYNPRHRWVYTAILRLYENGIAVDYTTLGDEMRRQGVLEDMGGPPFLATLVESVVSAHNVEWHANIVRDKFRLRELIRTCDEIKGIALSEADEAGVILDRAEKEMFELAQQRAVRDFSDMATLTLEVINEVEQRSQNEHAFTGVETGYDRLDQLTGGLQRSDLIILAARPSVGKTALALNIAANVAIGVRGFGIHRELRRAVGVFSLEMSANQVMMRLLSTVCRVPMHLMRTGKLSAEYRQRLHRYGRDVHDAPLAIDDTANISLLELRAKARRLAALHPNLSVIMIDYLQLMRGGGRTESRQQEVAEITRGLKALARELDIPIIALSQLSRGIEQRKGRHAKPMLSDLRESGAIEQDADVVLFLHREKQIPEEGEVRPAFEESELIIGKQRNGPLDTIPLMFECEVATYRSRDDRTNIMPADIPPM